MLDRRFFIISVIFDVVLMELKFFGGGLVRLKGTIVGLIWVFLMLIWCP